MNTGLRQLYQDFKDSLIELRPIAGSHIALGYSGGVDSELLAYLLQQFSLEHPQYRCTLIHIDHNMSPNSGLWRQHCIERAKYYGLAIDVENVEIAVGARQSKEARGREVRYRLLNHYLAPNGILLTAQHQSDQAETFLLALKRGSGPSGLKGMVATQPFGDNARLHRPLLAYTKQQIHQFAQLAQLKHVEDETNLDTKIERNFLRHEVIPLLQSRWPQVSANISRSAKLIEQERTLLHTLLADKYQSLLKNGHVQLSLLTPLDKNMQYQMLRFAIKARGALYPSEKIMHQMVSQLSGANSQSNIHIVWQGWQLRQYLGVIYIDPVNGDEPLQDIELEPNQSHPILLAAYQQGLIYATKQQRVAIRYNLAGATKCQPEQRERRRELKKLWHEYQVPPWIRPTVPMVLYDDKLVCALGYWIEQGYR